MKKTAIILLAMALSVLPSGHVCAQQQSVYVDASAFPVYGKAIENTSALYERLPASLEGVIRKPVWDLAHHSAGISIRFRSNSTPIRLRWISFGLHTMNHMTRYKGAGPVFPGSRERDVALRQECQAGEGYVERPAGHRRDGSGDEGVYPLPVPLRRRQEGRDRRR